MDLPEMQLAKEGAKADELEGLPKDLRAFLEKHDGGKGRVSGRPLVLWSAKQIRDEAEQQEISLAVKGLVLFGTDGGAEGYGYLPRLQQGKYGRISLLAAGAHEFEALADTFDELIKALAEGR
jgi:SMI1 / KNR4 family (SUKH-1)